MDGWFHINGTWMMTAQERKDFRRVQKSREVWKKRAVRRGEDRRRLRERRQEVDRSREAWRERALAAEHRTRQLEIANHQLQSALTRAPEPSTIDNTHFFKFFASPSGVALYPLVPRLEQSAPFLSSGGCWSDFLGASLHDRHWVGLTGRLTLFTTGSASPR